MSHSGVRFAQTAVSVALLPRGTWRVDIYVFLPVPVYRYVNETQLAPRLSLVAGVSRSF